VRKWRSNRIVFLGVCLFICAGLIAASQLGILGPIRGIAAVPFNFVTGIFNRLTVDTSKGVGSLADMETLRQRNADLEDALARFQAELVELREIASDYQRLSALVNYTSATQNQEFIAADVISNVDPNAPLRALVINRGTRDGLAVGMPVVTQQGLVGRIVKVAANASQVLLITDPSSAISARLQTTRAEGSVVGQGGDDLHMTFIPLDADVKEGDLVITSGLGGNLPSDIAIGQVVSVRLRQNALYQEAVLRSLNNFDTLEIVLVVTNFQPVDLSVFEDQSSK
jgi:rod shape-determining protein MreC